MLRFGLIAISFAFLGLSFYEMSGGKDFDAEALRLSRVDAPRADTAQIAALPAPAPQPEVTRVALNLTSIREVGEPAPAPQPQAQVIPAAAPASEPPRIVIQSPIQGATPEGSVQVTEVDFNADPAPAVQRDIRAVTGSRVNVRGGPGTDFSVVNRLTRGAEVEILQDPGTGWVKLRPVGGGPVGWMADFLLREAG
ncbi:MAG: SH3 domain-containing protein [Pseudomonadota bacterium]